MIEYGDADEWPEIHRYTRAQAIDDGVLVDVTKTAQEAGFLYPVALSASVWAQYVAVPEEVSWQDEQGRLWDILSMLRYAITQVKGGSPLCMFELLVQNTAFVAPVKVQLKSVCGPGDTAEPVITVMLPGED